MYIYDPKRKFGSPPPSKQTALLHGARLPLSNVMMFTSFPVSLITRHFTLTRKLPIATFYHMYLQAGRGQKLCQLSIFNKRAFAIEE